MGLSQGQKKRLYGEQAQQGQSRPQSGRKPQEHKIHELKQVMDDRAVRANAPAEQQRSKTFLYVAVTISLLLGAYVAFWVLPSYGRLANAQVPDLSPITSAEALSAFASGLGDNLGAYTYAHRSVGIVFALFWAFAGVSGVHVTTAEGAADTVHGGSGGLPARAHRHDFYAGCGARRPRASARCPERAVTRGLGAAASVSGGYRIPAGAQHEGCGLHLYRGRAKRRGRR